MIHARGVENRSLVYWATAPSMKLNFVLPPSVNNIYRVIGCEKEGGDVDTYVILAAPNVNLHLYPRLILSVSYMSTNLVPSPSETWFRGMSVGGSFRRV